MEIDPTSAIQEMVDQCPRPVFLSPFWIWFYLLTGELQRIRMA